MHKFNIGTITSDKFVNVKYIKGKSLGNLEENFASKLSPGDTFYFAGKMLQFVRIRDMILYVKKSSKKSSLIPAWVGGQMAISDLLSESLRKEIDICNKLENNDYLNPELNSLIPILNPVTVGSSFNILFLCFSKKGNKCLCSLGFKSK